MANTLLFLTNQFPYGLGEAFIETEIVYLSKAFEKVIILPVEECISGQARPLPPNVRVADIHVGKGKEGGPIERSAWALSMVHAVLSDLFGPDHKGSLSLKALKRTLHGAVSAGRVREKVKDILAGERVTVAYSFWSNYGAAGAISALGGFGKKVPMVCRVHGYDLFWERQDPPFVLFQRYIVEGSDLFLPDSLNGGSYLKEKYPMYSKRISARYLGTRFMGNSTPSSDGTFRIVSCSSLIPLKRVHLIPEALGLVEGRVQWTHFGDGPERDKVRSTVEKVRTDRANLDIVLKGHVKNKEILDHYMNSNVDLFVHMSEYEGLPVSIMEALSFSVPVVAADSGGIRELVGGPTGCGQLLPHDPTSEEIASAIGHFMTMDEERSSFERKKAYETWERNVSADRNFADFTEELKGMIKGHSGEGGRNAAVQ